ncbi:hypothetical protein C8R46DRAFT_1194840 [Mycena filopes]|nr:hypothetical protein C8R46DRAFT_1194840 [Mycena filopes]
MASTKNTDDAFSAATRLVENVFQEVHDEFTAWKLDYASRALLAVAQAPSPTNLSEPSASFPARSSPIGASSSGSEYLEIWDQDTDETKRVAMKVISVPDVYPPPPAYEHCTPTVRNISHGDDPSDLGFLPFPDHPTFDHAAYLDEFKRYSWERPVPDPDVEVVVVETARRLRTEHQMLYHHIDETAVLPLELLDRGGVRGMVYRSRRRDFPNWPPDVPSSAKPLPSDADALLPPSPASLLAAAVSTFCTNLNCVTPFCSTHLDLTPMPPKVAASIQNHRMHAHVHTPCSPDCFRSKATPSDDEPIEWPPSSTHLLRTLLDHGPDATPCDLAAICARPCFEAFALRARLLPDAASSKHKGRKKGGAQPKMPRGGAGFGDFDTSKFTPGKPCTHEGPCSAVTQCVCYLNKAHCESGCRCSRKCTRRWRGCTCAATTATATTKQRGGAGGAGGSGGAAVATMAICRTSRECDPEICLRCQAKDAEADVCKNADIQRARWKKTTVAPGRWGIGLFLAEPAGQGDLVIEYVGELIFDPTTESREPVAMHRGRNYLFAMNNTLSVDGAYAGNDARYINHDAQRPNCVALVRMVNGEHRIGVYATRAIKAGEEVLFNYGDNFFRGEAGTST